MKNPPHKVGFLFINLAELARARMRKQKKARRSLARFFILTLGRLGETSEAKSAPASYEESRSRGVEDLVVLLFDLGANGSDERSEVSPSLV
jgi:hypothetical protein